MASEGNKIKNGEVAIDSSHLQRMLLMMDQNICCNWLPSRQDFTILPPLDYLMCSFSTE